MIPGIPSLGGMELLILLAVILLFFGAKRIPDLARSLGKGTREFRKGVSEGDDEDDEAREGLKRKDREELLYGSVEKYGASRGEEKALGGMKAEAAETEQRP